MDGMALNIRIHPSALSTTRAAREAARYDQDLLDEGGLEVQYNIVDTATLRRAQEHPEDYKDLVVRIAGYSAYFVDLNHDQQERPHLPYGEHALAR